MLGKLMKKNKNCVLKLVYWTLFIVCLVGFVIQGFDCFQKWMSCPQGIHLSTQHQTEVDFPTITFCPEFFRTKVGNPTAYNWNFLDDCGVTDFEKSFIGTKCNDTKSIWQNATPSLEDFGFRKTVKVAFLDKTRQVLSEKDQIWSRHASLGRGVCYSFTLPKQIAKKGVFMIFFGIEADRYFQYLIHPFGVLNSWDLMLSLEYSHGVLFPNKSYSVRLEYQQNQALDFGGKQCEKNQSYHMLECVEEKVVQKCLDSVGCYTPFGPKNDDICTEETKAEKSLQIYKQEFINGTCMYPCNYLSNFIMSTNEVNPTADGTRQLFFIFKSFIRVNTSSCTYSGLDLFAAVGGYIGLFLGVSIFHLSDGVAYVIKRTI